MKTLILTIAACSLLISCTNIRRDIPVEKSTLTGKDYRLFQDTPAWELAKAVEDANMVRINEIITNDTNLLNPHPRASPQVQTDN